MKTKSHKLLGIYLADSYLDDCTAMERAAFLLGCVEPDRNLVTYIKGSLRAQMLRGHNFPNALPTIRRLSEKLEDSDGDSWRYFYRLGKLCHYVTDAFTWTHNSEFLGTLREHIQYEQRMAEQFDDGLRFADFTPAPAIPGRFYPWFLCQHSIYAQVRGGMAEDCRFAVVATKAMTLWLRNPSATYLTTPAMAGGLQ